MTDIKNIEIKNVDEQGNEIVDIDWDIWERAYIEEVCDDDGDLLYIISHCVSK